ncbi:hypothetical protein N0V82_000364 [Gnomoniopsis sp. IMI 355080]|nr:hypothetical protein N0V82_000364 [Gnomoniopsis sp. IMI 355080]
MTRIQPVYRPIGGDDGAAPPAYTAAHALPQTVTDVEDAKVEIRPLLDKKELIVTVQPPHVPQNNELSHTPCDIVLVIDVSGSMAAEALIPGSSDQESTGLSVLDLVKHACRTILSTLNEGDRLAIITFSNNARQIQELTVMNDANKKIAEENIEKMYVQGATNLWAGLRKGIECLSSQENTSRVPAVMLLTDGIPNHMCPPAGYVPALRTMGNIRPTIHTFGFGYKLRSGLLKSIAELGRGNYSFIPDAGMIGTVFVHAVAHLQSTFATNAVLNLVYPDHITIEQTAGPTVDQQEPRHVAGSQAYYLAISLGNIQYGQSRDVFLRWKSDDHNQAKDDMISIEVSLDYNRGQGTCSTCRARFNASDLPFTPAEIAYHVSRHEILAFLASLYPIDPLGEHRTCIPTSGSVDKSLRQNQEELRHLAANIPAAKFSNDSQCGSLVKDLISPEPFGQISLALSKREYFERWGQHYLLSIHGAHAHQLCNSFKDPGPLQYGVNSPLFIKCRNVLNEAFDNLPPPTPSILPVSTTQISSQNLHGQVSFRRFKRTRKMDSPEFDISGPDGGDLLRSQAPATMHDGRRFRLTDSMRDWNDPSAPCFAGRALVTLAKGTKIRISTLREGMSVATPMGPRIVAAVLVTPVKRLEMVRLQGVLVTPWHPVAISSGVIGSDKSSTIWLFPCRASRDRVTYSGCIYSVLLGGDRNTASHAIMLGGGPHVLPFWGVTLGHGILTGPDVRAHRFFGDYMRVVKNLNRLHTLTDKRIVTGGTQRSPKSGLICGFKAYT